MGTTLKGVIGSDISFDAHRTHSLALGDMDNDGDLDVIAGNYNNEPNRLYLNNGTEYPFKELNGFDISSDLLKTTSVSLGDVDRDGDLDLVTGNTNWGTGNGQYNRLYLNNGTNNPFNGVSGSNISFDTHLTWAVALGDLDGDGDLDLVAGNDNQPNRMYLNNGSQNPFSDVIGIDITTDAHETRSLALGDIDRDGDLDLVVGNYANTNRFYLNNGTSNPFSNAIGVNISSDINDTWSVALGDVDGDGDLDMVAGNFNNQSNRLYLNNGTIMPFQGINGISISTDTQATLSIALEDMDGDGDLDVVAGNTMQADRLYINNGTSNPFNSVNGFDISSEELYTISIVIGDVDKDGFSDILSGNNTKNRLYQRNLYNNSRGIATSLEIDTETTIIHEATINSTVCSYPINTNIVYYLSNNGGNYFYMVKPGVNFTFPTTGNDLRWRISLNSLSPIYSPKIDQIYITSNSIPSSLTTLSLEPAIQNVSRGQDIELAIRVTNNENIVGYRVALDLDPSKVTCVDGSATKEGTSTEIGWGPLVVNSASPELAIFTCASATGALADATPSLMKFQLHVNETLADFTPISVTFNPLTSLNEDAVPFSSEIWSATVIGANHIPTFTGGSSQIVLEDCGPQETEGWATNIDPGAPYEDWQSMNFTVDVNYPWLFSSTPTIDAASGTLRYTPAPNAYGTIDCVAILHDSGGTASGGIDQSTPYFFNITIDPVNDQPYFIAGATPVVLNATGGQHTFKNWATGISAGPPNEVTQTVNFTVIVDRPELFSATPYISPSGTLLFTPAVGAHGVVRATAYMYDSGGTANGGINMATPQAFTTKIYIRYLWGDLNDNEQAGSVDASLLLQYAAELIDVFPGYPVAEYPEYYPDPTRPWLYFPLAADVNADGIAGTWDASLVLQKYAFLIEWFPADINHDQWGPDAPLPPGKVSVRSAERNLAVMINAVANSYYITFNIDDASELSGLRIGLLYDPAQLSVDEDETKWLAPNGMLVTNNKEPGRFIAAGALTVPLSEGRGDLIQVKFDRIVGAGQTVLIQIDEQLTQINDGQIQLGPNSIKVIDVSRPTDVREWMVH